MDTARSERAESSFMPIDSSTSSGSAQSLTVWRLITSDHADASIAIAATPIILRLFQAQKTAAAVGKPD
jgi:hypothetical protein